jgi:diguanylate cyclase (GGDEF)-like protein
MIKIIQQRLFYKIMVIFIACLLQIIWSYTFMSIYQINKIAKNSFQLNARSAAIPMERAILDALQYGAVFDKELGYDVSTIINHLISHKTFKDIVTLYVVANSDGMIVSHSRQLAFFEKNLYMPPEIIKQLRNSLAPFTIKEKGSYNNYIPIIYENDFYGVIQIDFDARLIDDKILLAINTAIVFSLISLIIASIVFSVAITVAITRPLRKIVEKINYITETTDLESRVETNAKDEIGVLANDFNQMIDAIQLALNSNPITKLPGNNSVANRIKRALQKNEKVCVIYADLDNFKAYNDKYGFAKGDEVILFTCHVLKEAIASIQCDNSFVGHIGGDDFVVLAPTDQVQLVADEIIQRFDKGIVQFYSSEDAQNGYIQSINRQGQKQTFPLMSLSLAGVDLSQTFFKQYLEVNDACAITKKMAKAKLGSSFVIDRRSYV